MTPEEINGLFAIWDEALGTGDPDQVTALYATDAVLLPTLSNRVRTDHEGIRDYFVGFCAKGPRGAIDETHTRVLADRVVSNSGIYTFTFADGSAVSARFSYVYRNDGDSWKIIEHHSSAMPEG
ncbi:MAG: SgcJ/EcaC family oxidoreductase [Actinomycetota bacterium]